MTILQEISDFGFHCIRSWQSLVQDGNDIQGVSVSVERSPRQDTLRLWSICQGQTLRSTSCDRAVEPLNFMQVVPSPEQQSLIQWVFDRIYVNIKFESDGRAYYHLPGDDSYPNTAHAINDTQARVIHLLIQLLNEEQGYFDLRARQQASDSANGLVRYLLSQQLFRHESPYEGFWSFHKYDDQSLDGFQVLTINSELAVKALEAYWGTADANLKKEIAQAITEILTALRRTALKDAQTIGWQKHFSTLSSEDNISQGSEDKASGVTRDRESSPPHGVCLSSRQLQGWDYVRMHSNM